MKAPTLDLNEEELRQLLASEDSTSFTIPLILSQFKPTVDKSGSFARVLDVIINTNFYINKISFSQLYKTFLITVSLETIESKCKSLLEKNDWILLKNKKYQESSGHNSSANHKIGINCDKSGDKSIVNDLNAILNINDINHDESDDGNDGLDYEYVNTNINNKLIENINNSNNDGNYGPKTESDSDRVKRPQTQTILNHRPEDEGVVVVSSDHIQGQTVYLTPKYVLKFDVFSNCLDGRVILPSISDSNQLDLHIGEDRIVLMSSKYKLDIFVSLLIKCSEVSATFDAFTHILDIKMPLI